MPTRLDLFREHERAAAKTSSVAMGLGTWAGRGDWATFADTFRDQAGRRALTDLNTAISELTAVRDRLAAALAAEDDDGRCGRPTGPDDLTCTLAPGHTGDCMWIKPGIEIPGVVRSMLATPSYLDTGGELDAELDDQDTEETSR